MKLAEPLGQLCYCTNIHPGEIWVDVSTVLAKNVPLVLQQLCSQRPPESIPSHFGIGLRLSAAAAAQLRSEHARTQLISVLTEEDFSISTVNGFPYGAFHGVGVKEAVYRPDWLEEERLEYTKDLIDLLCELPSSIVTPQPCISTSPGAFKERASDSKAANAMADRMLRAAAHAALQRDKTGVEVRLALEPEPCCFIETVAETIAFFEERLFSEAAAARFAELTGFSTTAAAQALRAHLGVCYDVCHAAVEFEDPVGGPEALEAAGVPIFKLQLSSALRAPSADRAMLEALAAFNETTYLHQVVARDPNGAISRYADLPMAIAAGPSDAEWRVHFHVPLFAETAGVFETTQSDLKSVLARHRSKPIAPCLEIETYTWSVLPEEMRTESLEAAIAREIDWTLNELLGEPAAASGAPRA